MKINGVLAIDPSIRATGVAVFEKQELVFCTVIRPTKSDDPKKCKHYNLKEIQKILEKEIGWSVTPEAIIAEVPEVYQVSKGNPNQLMHLAVLDGMILGRLKAQQTFLPLPKEWKGQVPKEIHNAKALAKLSRREKELVVSYLIRTPESIRHNAYDAIALGQWALERMK